MVALSLLGCGSERDTPVDQRDPAKQCTPGQETPCACGVDTVSVQVCGTNGYFEACQCGGGGGGGGGGGHGDGGGGVHSAQLLDSGTAKLIDVFPTSAGVMVITIDAVRMVDRMGTVMKEIAWPREIRTAAFDGEHLVIADAAKMATLDIALTTLADGDLTEVCAASVLLGAKRFVCGPGEDWQRIFRTYDALTATEIAASEGLTYHGIPMRRVPATGDFVTVSVGTSPADFFLHRMGADGTVGYINESKYHGDFGALEIFGFVGNPPTHLVNHEGLMLRLGAEGCAPGSVHESGCFVKDGNVGTLAATELFLGLDSDAAGALYGFVTAEWGSGTESMCEHGCRAQRIDAASHTVLSERTYTTDLGGMVATRHDATANALVIGYRLSGAYYFDDDPYPGYRVSILPYQ